MGSYFLTRKKDINGVGSTSCYSRRPHLSCADLVDETLSSIHPICTACWCTPSHLLTFLRTLPNSYLSYILDQLMPVQVDLFKCAFHAGGHCQSDLMQIECAFICIQSR